MRSFRSTDAMKLLAGVGLGAAAMYFWDPDRGRARRAQAQDQTAGRLRSTARNLQQTRSGLGNRARGMAAEFRGQVASESVSDRQLVERVRAELGHHTGSLQALEVNASDGEVTLRGFARGISPDAVIDLVEHVRGVELVNDLMDRSQS